MAAKNSFPDNSIRGLINSGDLNSVGSPVRVRSHVFSFLNRDIKEKDGVKWREDSINWQDDDSAINFTMNQTKQDGSIKFSAGVAILPRESIDRLNKQPAINGALSYERDPKPKEGNPYHGNLLLKAKIDEVTRKSFGACIAMAVTEILRNPKI